MYLYLWLNNLKNEASKNKKERIIHKIFSQLLQWVYLNGYEGGCHLISAAMYILLSEAGIKSSLCLGEVKTGEQFFDHSWVEIDNKIYDVTLVMPLSGGISHPPVFASKDLSTNSISALKYGLTSGDGLNEAAQFVLNVDLGTYSRHVDNELFKITKQLSQEVGMKINIEKIQKKYSTIKRKLIVR